MKKQRKITKAELKEHFQEDMLWDMAQDVLDKIESLKKSRFDMPMGDSYDEYACRKIVPILRKYCYGNV